MKFSFVCWLPNLPVRIALIDTEYNCRARGAAIILMVAEMRKQKVWQRAQLGREKTLEFERAYATEGHQLSCEFNR